MIKATLYITAFKSADKKTTLYITAFKAASAKQKKNIYTCYTYLFFR